MVMKTIAAGLAGSLLLAGAALLPRRQQRFERCGEDRRHHRGILFGRLARLQARSASKFYNESNENVGAINDMLTDKGGTIKAVVIGVGGFLGMGEHLHSRCRLTR